jgi:nucleoside-diphosphate-sugar epimerase
MEQVRRADAEATRKAVGWEARNGLAQGLERTYHWYRNLAAAGIAGPEDPGTL